MVDLSVRPAQQRRSREAWSRVLDAGVAVLTERGSDGFTIAAVCERAGVTPPTVYRRAPNKDALFLAVYEHGIDGLDATEDSLRTELDPGLTAAARVSAAVEVVARIFLRHRAFLRSVIVISASNEVVRSKGVESSARLAALFEELTDPVTTTELRPARAALFQAIFGALVLRTGFGDDFASPAPTDDEEFIRGLQRIAAQTWAPPPASA